MSAIRSLARDELRVVEIDVCEEDDSVLVRRRPEVVETSGRWARPGGTRPDGPR